MKTNIKEKTGLKKHEFIFDYSCFDENEKEVRKEGSYIIQDPQWDEVAEAYKYITDENGKLDLVTPGKIIFDLCCIEIDDDVIENNQLMLSVCSQIAAKFVFPITAEMK